MFHNPHDNIVGSYRWEKRKINHKKKKKIQFMCSPIFLYVTKESLLTIQIPKFGGKRVLTLFLNVKFHG